MDLFCSYFFQEQYSYYEKEDLDQEIIDGHGKESRYELLNAQLVSFTHELCLEDLMISAIVVEPIFLPVNPLFERRNRGSEEPFDDKSKETGSKGVKEEDYSSLMRWSSLFFWDFLDRDFLCLLLTFEVNPF